jgi:hypothetical protein
MTKLTRFAVAILALAALASAANAAAPIRHPVPKPVVHAVIMGRSGDLDLDELWTAAQLNNDLTKQDAVLLLEERRVDIAADGAVAVTTHRVVWIGTGTGLRTHADLRVPWNEATSKLEVTKLRTWREGRWWPDVQRLSDTAIVHTLPYAVDHAADYTTMRETMLLHDGVELPCIMETEYTITERGLPGADDVFVLAQRDPAQLVRLVVETPIARAFTHRELNGAPAPAIEEVNGRRTLTWTLQPAPALRSPVTAEPSVSEPTVAWSTWANDGALGQAWIGPFREAAVAPRAMRDSVRAALRTATDDQSRLQVGAKWLADRLRVVHHDDRFWTFGPRSAVRTWETGYGHVLDVAALWTAVLQDQGWRVTPVLADTPGAPEAPDLPHLAGRGKLLLHVGGNPVMGATAWVCDPSDFSVHTTAFLEGRPLLWLGNEPKAEIRQAAANILVVELNLAAGDTAWAGSGSARGVGRFAFTESATATTKGLADHAGALAGSLVTGAKVASTTATAMGADQSAIRFDLAAPLVPVAQLGKAAADDRRKLVIGRPKGGLLDRLPGDCRLDDDVRATPVGGIDGWEQVVTVRLQPPKDAVVVRPADRAVANEAGTFMMATSEQEGVITFRRELKLAPGAGAAANWPALRALLLEEADAANATLAWRPKK